MSDLDDIFKEGFELDTGEFYKTVISYLNKNQTYLLSIHNKQIEILELLKGKTGQELDESVKEKIIESLQSVDDFSQETYYKLIQKILN